MISLKVITPASWLVIEDENSIGVLVQSDSAFSFMSVQGKQVFATADEVIQYFSENVFDNIITSDSEVSGIFEVSGYPTSHKNAIPSGMSSANLPIYKKSESSNVFYCAGYYGLKFSSMWSPAFCPKLSTLENTNYIGPFKTEIEMRAELSLAKRNN